MADTVTAWEDPAGSDDESLRFFVEALRLVSRLSSRAGEDRVASLFRLQDDVLTWIASSAPSTLSEREPLRVAEHPELGGAITGREIKVGALGAVVPVPGSSTVIGLLVTGGATSLDDRERGTLTMLADVVGLGMRQAERIDQLRQEAERSRRLERLKSEFLNIAAHELRSPLGIIRGYSSMLSEGTLGEPDREIALARIADKAEEMARLISEMLDTARLEALGLELALEPVDLRVVVDDAITATRPRLGDRHEFALRVLDDPVPVIADRRRLTTMLTNLIDNAIKYSPHGGAIEVTCERDTHAATIRVRDHGIGINTEQAHLLFTRFGRIVTPETSHIRGTGLGLYLARETARLHGGDIVVTATPGGGSTFTVDLPVA